MIVKYGKKMDFRDLGRDAEFIEKAGLQNADISQRTYKNGTANIDCCPICKSGSMQSLKEINCFQWKKCEMCGHFFVVNVPIEVSGIYEAGNEAQTEAYISDELFKKRRLLISKPKAEFIDSIIPPKKTKGLWVDIGCGVGELLSEAALLGWETVGFEADPNEVEFARSHGIEVRQTYISGNFDTEISENLSNAKVVSIINVLEHISSPLDWLNNVVAHMSKGAYLAIEVPREPSLTALCNLLGLPYKHMMTAGHYHIFTEKSMEVIQTHCSLEIMAKWCFGNGFVDLINTALLLSGHDVNSAVIDTILEKTPDVQSAVDEAGLSEAMIVVFRVV